MTNLTFNERLQPSFEIIIQIQLTKPDNPFDDIYEIIFGYVSIVIFLIGIPGNIICLAVFLQKDMQNSSGFYLMVLAIADLSRLCLIIISDLHEMWDVNTLDYNGWCQIVYVLLDTTCYMSPILALGFTVERFISVFYPLKRVFYCSVKRAKMVVAGMLMFVLAVNFPNAYFYDLIYIEHLGRRVCTLRNEIETGGVTSVNVLYLTVVDELCFVGVNAAILVLNVLVLAKIKRNFSNKRTQLQLGHGRDVGSNSRSELNPNYKVATAMLIGVSCYQIVSTTPASIMFTLYYNYYPTGPYKNQEDFDRQYLDYYEYNFIRLCFMVLRRSHYAANIIIYLLTGKTFRKTLRRLMPKCPC